MRQNRFLISLFNIVIALGMFLLLVPARPVHAAPEQEDEVILGNDLILREGEHVNGDLVIVGGNLTLRAGSRVQGSVTALGGQVEIDGTVEGDLVALVGDVTLGARAHIQGDTVALGGRVQQAEGAQTGKIIQGLAFNRTVHLTPFPRDLGSPVTLITLIGAVFLALLGMAIVTFWPTQTATVGETILIAPLPSLGVGCLLYPLTGSFALFILITICLSPFVPVVVLLVVAASLLGWVALGTLLGRQLLRWLGWRKATPVAVTGTGVFALTAMAIVLGAIPCLGSILILGAISVGLGAVTLSRFGTSRRRPRSSILRIQN